MSDPLTATIRLTEPTVGGDSGTWGSLLNSNMVYVDEAVNQTVTVSIADTNISLVADGSSGDQARYLRYNFTGALTADRTVTLPANMKVGYASNNTSGGHNVILSAGGTTLSLADGSWTFFAVDGSNNVTAPVVSVGGLSASSGTGAASLALIGNTNYIIGAATTSGAAVAPVYAFNASNAASAQSMVVRNDRVDGTAIQFLFGSSTNVGRITQNGVNTTYGTSSDARLKTHIGPILNSGTFIDKLIPRWFQWKGWEDRDPEPGFFAQQVHKVFPWAVVKGTGKPGSKNFQPWQMDASKLLPIVIAELQSLRRRVAELEK